MSVLFVELLRHHDLVARLEADGTPIDMPKLTVYMRHIEDNYGDNPYHNRMHAADVVLSASLFFTEPLAGVDVGEGASATLAHVPSALELFATLFAAAIHDYAHPGTTNAHEARKSSALGLTHNHESILESHHLASALADLFKPAHNFVRCSSSNPKPDTTPRLSPSSWRTLHSSQSSPTSHTPKAHAWDVAEYDRFRILVIEHASQTGPQIVRAHGARVPLTSCMAVHAAGGSPRADDGPRQAF